MKRTPLTRKTALKPSKPAVIGPARRRSPPPTPITDCRARMATAADLVEAHAPAVKTAIARPGRSKAAPTVDEKRWMDAITRIGCIACLIDGHPGTPGAVHHILHAGRRIGHLHTICLCDPGHHQGGQPSNKISRHPWKARFEARYGTEDELLEKSKLLVQGLA